MKNLEETNVKILASLACTAAVITGKVNMDEQNGIKAGETKMVGLEAKLPEITRVTPVAIRMVFQK